MTGLAAFLWQWYSRRSLWTRRLFLFGLGGVLLGGVVWFTPTPYYVLAPGAAVDTSRMVAVKGGTAHGGRLYLLIVATQPANFFWYLYANLDDRAVLETKEEFLGEIADYSKYVQLTRQMMANSQKTAMAVALQLAGYGEGVRAAGVRVVDFTAASPAMGYLQEDDIIVECAGLPVRGTQELRDVARSISPGSRVPMKVMRGGAVTQVDVPTTEHTDPEREGTAAFGILILDELEYDIPVPVDIKAGAITGPSAGLMFTLQIIDQLTPGGIARDHVVAGTGTIEPDGSIGAIGGMRQKVYTAEVAGANVLFVPQGNYAEAKAAATRIEVVPVDTVLDSLLWLRTHTSSRPASSQTTGRPCLEPLHAEGRIWL